MMSPLEELRHSASHILATAILRIFPDAKLDIGPPTDTGFYYDIDLDHKLTADDLVKLEAEMKKVADENQRFDRKEVSLARRLSRSSPRAARSATNSAVSPTSPRAKKFRSTKMASSWIFAPARTCAIPPS